MNKVNDAWRVKVQGFEKEAIDINGSKFMIGNGYMGFRGVQEEFTKNEKVSCTLSGIYDRQGDLWREPVNAPNGFFTQIYFEGKPLSVLTTAVESHEQGIDIECGLHFRETVFSLSGGNKLTVRAERFLSAADVHVGGLRYSVTTTKDCELEIRTGIDADVWDLNGPHLEKIVCSNQDEIIYVKAQTQENKIPVVVAESLTTSLEKAKFEKDSLKNFRVISFKTKANTTVAFEKYISVYTGKDVNGDEAVLKAAIQSCEKAKKAGYDSLLEQSRAIWRQRWAASDVQIEGDDEAQSALRYSIYHLLIIAPTHTDKASIPARGLSGQVYKGGIFWDTEIFMQQFFDYTQPEMASNLLNYRYHTLDGARRKAQEYGHKGAFYAWESQETGDDACTLFNITDVFTNRPMRTYFRDKQVHISADVAFAIWRHYQIVGNIDILLKGGAEVIFECARFFLSYAYFCPEKNRFEILDVVGPDEYHERVNNNFFTSSMVAETFSVALQTIELLEEKYPEEYSRLVNRIGFDRQIDRVKEMRQRLFVPQPDPKTGVIEQFSGYYKLEDVDVPTVKKRVMQPTEYWGGGHGIATTTQVIKQADVILMLHLQRSQYSAEIKRANWEYYEPRTEHGSSLSPCVYALVAAEIGKTQWAYDYFLKTATIDLTGKSKQYVGTLYIGGTHPAANGGAWMAAVLGFGGLQNLNGAPILRPAPLPERWKKLSFRFFYRKNWLNVSITPQNIQISAEQNNPAPVEIEVDDKKEVIKPGQSIQLTRKNK